MMVRCYECGCEIDEEGHRYECPYCGEDDFAEGYWECESCGTLMDYNGDMWECENCQNDGITEEPPRRRVYYDDDDDCYLGEEYCEDGIPDVNQGWVGENYG
jgi:predicted RNA-binding Zn-ribbon protein involved in translation (DUF1610 family)